MSRPEEDERLTDLAAKLANEPFEQADALRALADALDRGEPLPLAIARPSSRAWQSASCSAAPRDASWMATTRSSPLAKNGG